MPRSEANTAAASVDETAAPSSSQSVQSRSATTCAESATTAAVVSTPSVARSPAGCERPPYLGALGKQAALDQDHHERDRAGIAGERRVVEVDTARPVLAEQHAEAEEDEQRRRPQAVDELAAIEPTSSTAIAMMSGFGDVQRCAPPGVLLRA